MALTITSAILNRAAADIAGAAPVTEVAFIDPAVADLDVLLGGLRPDVEPILLNATEPAPRQMASALAGRRGLEAIHIIAHGAPGEAAGALSADGVAEHAGDLAALGARLGPNASLMLWTCETGQGARGQDFIAALASASGVQVAAATRLVGAAERGGCWELDTARVAPMARAPLTAAGTAGYQGLMVTRTWGGATSSAWTTGTNWSGNTVPVAGDDVVITSAGTNAPTLSASRSIGSLSFTGTKTLTLANTGTVLTVTGVVPTTTFGVNFTGTGDVITGTGTINAANGINVATGGSATITVGANGLTVTGVLSKVGTGTLALSLPSSSDVLALTSAGSSVTSVTFTGSSRTLQLGANATLTVDNQVALSGGANNLITLGGPNSALTGLAGFTFGSTGTISGAGTVTGAVTAGTQAAHLTATGGTLIMASTVTGTALILTNSTSAATLQFNAAGNTAATLTLNNGTLKLNGATAALTVSSSTTLGTGTITGFGTFTGAVAAAALAGHVTANGGTLVMNSPVTGTALLLADTAATDTLQFNAAGNTASSVTLNGGTLRLNAGTTTLTVTNALVVGSGTVNLVAAGATLTDNNGLTLAGGSITGLGSVAVNTNISGFGTVAIPISTGGTITASGGTLDLTGAVTGRTLAIGTLPGSDLKIDGTSISAAAIAISDPNQTLEIGAPGALTINAAESITNGAIQLDGGTLTDNAGLTVGSGAKLIGKGTVTGAIAGGGNIEASGGTLNLNAASIGSNLILKIDGGATLISAGTGNAGTYNLTGTNSTLSLGGNLATGTVNFDAVPSDSENLALTSPTLNGSVGTITGFSVSDVIQLTGFATAAKAVISGGHLLLEDGSNTVLYTVDSFTTTDPDATALGFNNTGGVVTLTLPPEADNDFIYTHAGDDTNFPTAYAWSNAANWELGAPINGEQLDLEEDFLGGVTVDNIPALTVSSLIPSSGLFIIDNGSTLTVGTGGILNPGTVEIRGTLVVNALTQPLFGETILMKGGTLQSPDGGTVGDATTTLTGSGSVSGGTISGTGTITASDGTLAISNAIDSGSVLAIDPTVASDLLINGIATANAAISISDANQTLEIGATGDLTINAAEGITNGKIKLDGGSITDNAGLTIGSGATLIGKGFVNGAIAGSGAVVATGGILSLTNDLTSGGLLLAADSAALSTLALGGTISTSTSFTYLNTDSIFSGTLLLANSSAMSSFGTNGVISDMHVATGDGLTPTDILDLRPILATDIGSTDILGGNTIEVWDVGHSQTLATFQLADSVDAGTFVDWQADGSGGTNLFLDDDPCYVAGTRILTVTGERMVETLMQGDIVLTLAGGELSAQPVKWTGRRRIDLTAHPRPETVAPIRIRSGAFADNMPHSDLLVSPDHAIFVDGKLICARQLVNGSTIAQEQGFTSVEYFHVELETHAILLAEGLPAESYLNTGNHGFFTNSGAPLVLHPGASLTSSSVDSRSTVPWIRAGFAGLVSWGLASCSGIAWPSTALPAGHESDYPTREAGSCAPFVSDEVSVRPVWQRLADRAAALGQPAVVHETTTDPALQLVAKGRKIKPIFANADLAIFVLPRSASEVGLVSRAASPPEARPWLDDRRRLGVPVARIVLRGADEVREIPVDHPSLGKGWWAIERDGQAMSRWTDGEAVLPLPAMRGDTMLEIHLAGTMTYVVEAAPVVEAARRVA